MFEKTESGLDGFNCRPIIPYIKPFGERFDPSQLPYFKYRKALADLETQRGAYVQVIVSESVGQ